MTNAEGRESPHLFSPMKDVAKGSGWELVGTLVVVMALVSDVQMPIGAAVKPGLKSKGLQSHSVSRIWGTGWSIAALMKEASTHQAATMGHRHMG